MDYSLLVLPSLSDTGRIRLEANTRLSRDIVGDLDMALNVYDSFDSRPPSAGRRNDAGVTVTLGWRF